MMRLSFAGMLRLEASGPGFPSILITKDELEPPPRPMDEMLMSWLLLFITLTCCVTVAVAAKTVSKLTVSAERKRRTFPFRFDCFWQEISRNPARTDKNRALNIKTKIQVKPKV